MDKRPRSRRKEKNNIRRKTTVTFIGVLIGLGIAGGIILSAKGVEDGKTAGELTSEATPADAIPAETMEEGAASLEISIAPQQEEQLEAGTNEAGILRSTERTPNPGQAVVNTYENIGLADVSGYLNIRKEAGADGEIIGMLRQNAVCEILGAEGEWYHISSGGIDGYINSQYVLTGEEAQGRALEEVKPRAVVTGEHVNIRREPVLDPVNVAGQAFAGERYEVVAETDGWVQTDEGYLSSEYVEVRESLDEARGLDLKTEVWNQYDNIVISKVRNYLNIRSSPENQGSSNVIGQMPGYAAGEILETLDGWYRIRSGSIVGYISSDTQYTAVGAEALQLALESAELMAIVSTERLNVRMEPSTESRIWTQISQEERYHVVSQMDGWVQIELDSIGENDAMDGAYISTRDNNVEVRYALAEAIPFTPLVEDRGNGGGSSGSGNSGGNGTAQAGGAPAGSGGQASSLGTRVVNYALQFVGNPYVWGGTSLTNGADCSGFVQSVMRNFGISLPRTSRAQSAAGTAVSSSQMQPGDLIFYANGSGTVNHVALYIGGGQVVHASSRRTGIRISTWNYRTPSAIRRVL